MSSSAFNALAIAASSAFNNRSIITSRSAFLSSSLLFMFSEISFYSHKNFGLACARCVGNDQRIGFKFLYGKALQYGT